MTTSLRISGRISGLGTALVVACGLFWLGCGGGHDSFQEVRSDECGACHLSEYQSTNQPNHYALSQQGMTYTLEFCPQCHATEQWRPPYNPNLHPDSDFLISDGPHTPDEVACADCHDPTIDEPSKDGQNANCVGCHTANGDEPHAIPLMDEVHKEDPDYPSHRNDPADPTADPRPNFCLDCHTNGLCDDACVP
jgi:hypothetical protein